MAFVPSASFWADSAEAKPKIDAAGITVPVDGTVSNGTAFVGSFTINRFAVQGTDVVALGTLVGTMTVEDKPVTVVTPVAMKLDRTASGGRSNAAAAAAPIGIAQVAGECDILHLVLGPLDLDLLGLSVNLNQVILDIVAVTGAGNLLGNLLCAVVGLLDGVGTGVLNQIAQLLNQILGALLG
jgi:hypothetical protein